MSSYPRVTDEKYVIPLPSVITRAFWSQPVALVGNKVRLHVQTQFVKDGAKVSFKIYRQDDEQRTNVLRPQAGKTNPKEGKINKNECYVDFKIDFEDNEIGKHPWKFIFVAEIADYALQATSNVLTVTELLRVRFLNEGGQPRDEVACQVSFDGHTIEKFTDKEGIVEVMLAPGTAACLMMIEDEISGQGHALGSEKFQRTWTLKIKQLKPVTEVAGQQARLANLGYYRRSLDKMDEEELRSATEEFQCDYNLPVNGKCDAKTQAKLKQVHGC